MRRVDLSRQNGQWQLPKVRQRIRRKLWAAINQGECVLVDADEADLDPIQLEEIVADLPDSKAKIIWMRKGKYGTK